MTERARERETYKSKKRLPAPEVPKPKGKHKPEKNILLQYRWTPEYVTKINKESDKNGNKETVLNGKIFKYRLWRIDCNDWRTEGKYADMETAEMVLARQKLHHPAFWQNYEYRIISKEDYKKEKNEKK